MDFQYTEEQIQLRKSVREFAEAEILPHVMEWDEAQTFPLETIRKLGKLGYLGSIFPEELGGAGMGYVDYSIIIEELSRVDGSVGIIVAAHTSLCSNHIFKVGDEEQRERYLPKLASGELKVEEASKLLSEAEPKRGQLYCKVSEKGAISVYGLQRMPVTLYVEQWERLLNFADDLREFIKEHDAEFKRKEK